jgi:hypothetical protein
VRATHGRRVTVRNDPIPVRTQPDERAFLRNVVLRDLRRSHSSASESDGIYVGSNSSTKGASAIGTPGAIGEPYGKGDWMIQVELDRAK